MGNRRLTRMPFKANVELIHKNKKVRGEILDLSMGGMFVITFEKLDLNASVEIKICLGEDNKQVSLKLQGVITRVDDNGMAIEFSDQNALNKILSQAF